MHSRYVSTRLLRMFIVQSLTLSESATYVIARYPPVGYPALVAQDDRGGIGGNIKRARVDAGITTQAEFAKRLGVPQPQLSDWENDRYGTPDVTTLLKIAATIACSLDVLVKGIDRAYDESISAREASSYKNKASYVTSSVPGSDVQQEHPGQGGSLYADSSGDRLSESQSATDAEMQSAIDHEWRLAYRLRLADQLDVAAVTVRTVADALRAGPDAATVGGKPARQGSGHPPLRRTGTRRGSR